VRAGTSICASALRASRQASADHRFGMHAVATSRALAGRWVNAIVRTRPIRRASRADSSPEHPASSPTIENSAPAAPTDSSKRRYSQSATTACPTNPPPSASIEKTAASRYTTRRDGPRPTRSPRPGSTAGDTRRYLAHTTAPTTAL